MTRMVTMPLANANSFSIPLRDKSVHCIVTSTPYFNLRVYNDVRPTVFGGRPDCEHVWTVTHHNPQPHGDDGTSGNLEGGRATQAQTRLGEIETAECSVCGAWRMYFGGEELHDCSAWARGEPPCGRCFVCHFRELAREIWRVLRDDGTAWIVIADSYARNGGTPGGGNRDLMHMEGKQKRMCNIPTGCDLKPKDKVMIPERVRLALQADGWWVRSVSPWLKKSSMPESTTDRPSVAHEDIIFLSKSQRYYFDSEAIRKPATASSLARINQASFNQQTGGEKDYGTTGVNPNRSARRSLENFAKRNKQDAVGNSTYTGFNARWKARDLSKTFARPSGKNTTLVIPGQAAPSHRANRDDEVPAGRNRRTTDWFFEGLDAMIEDAEGWLRYARSVRDKGGLLVDDDGNPLAFLVNPHGYKGAHYATFPIALVTPMILSSTSQYGVCPKCQAQWERVAEKERVQRDELPQDHPDYRPRRYTRKAGGNDEYANGGAQAFSFVKTLGWRPACAHYDDLYRSEWPRTANARKRYQQDARGDWFPRARQRAGSPDWEKSPAIVLDPFIGSGTTVEAAHQLGRIGIGLDISMQYLRDNALPRAERTNTDASMATLPLFADVL